MKVIGLLSWYDESPAWLAASVASMSKLCAGVVAVDGAYFGFPQGLSGPRSHPQQAEVIGRTAEGLGMSAAIVSPNEPWGSEVAKRDFMFRVAETMTTAEDWYLIIDADEMVSRAASLEDQTLDVGVVMGWDREYGGQYPIRRVFRALRGLGVKWAHYVYTAPRDGKEIFLFGPPNMEGLEPCFDSGIRLEHRASERSDRRKADRRHYDEIRNRFELERPQEALANV